MSLTATAVLSIALIALGQHPLRGQVAASRLSTVLADLVAAAPPRTQVLPAAPAGQARTLFDTLPVSVQDAMRGRRLRMDAASNVQVTVLLSAVTDDTIRDLTTAGAVIEIADAAQRRVQASVPASRLSAVAALPSVTFVQLPHYAVRRIGSVTSEGDSIMAADVARQQFGVDGTGVRVGVLSDGLKGMFAAGCTTCGGAPNGPIALGDLPNSTGTRTSTGTLTASTGGVNGQSFQANHDLEGLPPASPPCGFPGAGAEGTALLEVVHDIAPGAQLAFANADTDLAFNQAVNSLASSNDVVVDDLGFFGFAYDGTSPVSANTASALNNPANRIRAYVTSVGNDTDGHYLGGYVNSGTDISSISGVANPGHAHLFQSSGDTTDVLGMGSQSYDPIVLPTNGEVVIFLTWDDAFGRSGNNYDLYLVQQSTGRVVARSIDSQTGSQDPLEAIDFTNRGGSDTFRIIVQNVRDAAAPRTLNLFLFEPECAQTGPQLLASGRHEKHNYNTVSRSVAAQSDAGGSPVSVISVGAVCSASGAAAGAFPASESCNDRTHQTIEFYSSRGPTLDGRMKPDISAIDGVSVTGAGSFENPFFGTSAAAPHVAGEAALVLQGASCLIGGAAGAADPVSARTNLRNMILSGATPIGDAGPDNTFGVGLGNVFASVKKTLPAFSGPATIVVSGNAPGGASLTPAALGFSDPNHCALTRLSWTGGCGSSPAASLTCPFGTSSVQVAASNNGVSFSDATPLQITVTSFAVGASPGSATVAAGQAATYRVTLAAQGGAFTNAVNLSCANLPVGTSCAFAPASVAPGAGAVDTTLTIATTARQSLAEVRSSKFEVRSGAGALVMLAVVVAASAPRRRWSALASATGVVAFALVYASCGGSNNTPAIVNPTPTPTPPAGSPGAAVSPSSLTFGNQALQTTSAAQTLTLTNSGSAALAITSITASGDFAQTNSCGSSVAAGGSCTISVTFTPTSASARTGSVTITDNAASSPQTVALTGAGVPAAGGTPAGTYQIAITGTSGSLVQTQTVALIVQ
ncbi:MAG TPA: choice-of-anchor D domain-containing protein [Vicinamibacterales bacterium]|nr:choice-of-anchor D domain-containing protein [Vicinamibacterales bacterium]